MILLHVTGIFFSHLRGLKKTNHASVPQRYRYYHVLRTTLFDHPWHLTTDLWGYLKKLVITDNEYTVYPLCHMDSVRIQYQISLPSEIKDLFL